PLDEVIEMMAGSEPVARLGTRGRLPLMPGRMPLAPSLGGVVPGIFRAPVSNKPLPASRHKMFAVRAEGQDRVKRRLPPKRQHFGGGTRVPEFHMPIPAR